MELFMKYFVPAICLIFVGTMPLYITRIIMYFRRKHFLLQIESVKQAMYIHGVIYLVFLITTLFYLGNLNGMGLYLYICLGTGLLLLYLGYRWQFSHTKRHLYTVVFSEWDNREKWQKVLDDHKLEHVSIHDGAFSFVSKIKFTHMERNEIVGLFELFEKEEGLLQSLNTRKMYLQLAFQVFMFSLSILAYIIMFILLSTF